ncbi:uncharacterized protein LOC134207479 [Armigeres subalbatus]|uniref:uncharacterized protein LOC134207479 n=1 Tax=Armigeres subalbatus TaxID=124917 RepID=UPI002ED53E53
MGELPAARVTVSRPFSNTGVDYFGPVYVRLTPRRAAAKAYVAVFICMCTKAMHLELVTDLSTERFIQALRRFIGRRGRVTDIYSDNGTNFVGARNQMKQLFVLLKSREHHETVARECTKDEIQWHFNPPSAPHFGVLWEAVLTFEDMNTLLVQVEACLNSRPLTAMSDDPNDLEPGFFISSNK